MTAIPWYATPPARLARLLGVLLLACLALGVSGVWTAASHQGAAEALAGHDDRLSADARRIYRSLADADTTAVTSYLSGGIERPELRQRYLADLAAAEVALKDATTIAGADPRTAAPLEILTGQLPAYAGVIETARAENREGRPIGGAYLSEASSVMRDRLLPAADKVYTVAAANVADDQDRAGTFGYAAVVIALATLGILFQGQRVLSRRTNRTLNRGLLAASGAVALALVWTLVALTLQSVAAGDSRDLGSAQRDALVRAETASLRARSDENLLLTSGGQDASATTDYGTAAAEVDTYLAAAGRYGTAASGPVRDALTHVRAWRAAHARLVGESEAGDFTGATAVAVSGPAATEFAALSAALEKAVAIDQRQFTSDARTAGDVVTLLPFGLALLALIAAAGCAQGVGERMWEYR